MRIFRDAGKLSVNFFDIIRIIMTHKTAFSISDKALLGTEPFTEFSLLRDRGFTHIHFSYKWSSLEAVSDEEFDQLQQALKMANMKVLDVHGPRPGKDTTIGSKDPAERQLAIDRFRRRLKFTKQLGGDAMVYHVPERNFSEALLDRYVESLKRLEDEVRELGIVIALENHYVLENDRYTFTRCFEEFDSSYIGFTFDPGHANISGNTDWLLENCIDRLTILHLNDNDSTGDFHWNPFQPEGTVDWDAVAQGIAKSPYTKPLQFEVSWRKDKHNSREAFLDDSVISAQKMQDLVDKYREGK